MEQVLADDRRAGAPPLGGQGERAGALQLGEEKALMRPYSSTPVLKGVYRKAGGELVIRVGSGRTRGNGFEREECRLRPGIWKKFPTVRLLRHWDRLPSEAVNVPTLEAFEARLDGAVSNLV